MNLGQLDSKSKFLFRFNFVIWIALVIASVTYYQIIDSWNLDINTAILYSFLLGFGVAGLLVLSNPILSKITAEIDKIVAKRKLKGDKIVFKTDE